MKAQQVVTLIGFVGLVSILAGVALYKELAVYITVIALGMAVALQKYVTSFLAYLVIYYGKLFRPGDRVRIGSVKGDIRGVGILHTALDEVGDDEKLGGELTGRIMHIPNLYVLDQPVLNYSKEYSPRSPAKNGDYIFDEVRIPIMPTSDISQAKSILEEILRRGDGVHLKEAISLFGNRYGSFMREAERAPKVQIYLEPKQVWLKGKFATLINDRNSLRTQILLEFLSEIKKLNGQVTIA